VKTNYSFRSWTLQACFVASLILPALAQEVPPLENLKAPDRTWTLLERGTSAAADQRSPARQGGKYPYTYSWCVFKQEVSGDLMTVVVDRYAGIPRELGTESHMQSIGDRFVAGYPILMPDRGRFLKPETGWSVLSLKLPVPEKLVVRMTDGSRREQEALEYIQLYEIPTEKPAKPGDPQWLMGVGYAYMQGELAVYVQHTSKQVISQEEVRAYTQGLLSRGKW
jgi:hypothetical protein